MSFVEAARLRNAAFCPLTAVLRDIRFKEPHAILPAAVPPDPPPRTPAFCPLSENSVTAVKVKLVCQDPLASPREITLDRFPIEIGRGASADLRIDDR